jgi:hypothetical protein
MGVPIGDGDGQWLRPGPPKGGAPFHFTESVARAFVARAVASARLAAETGEPKLTFADLYRAVAPELPGWSMERLAGAYQRAYEQNPEAIAPQVLLGQPIEPETPLLYPQLWLLLVDGFTPPDGTPRPGRPTPAQTPSGAPAWGTGAQLVEPISGTWAQTVAPIIGHWIYQNAPVIQPQGARAHEGHGGPGRPVTLVASFPNPPQPIRAPNGFVMLDVRRPPELAGLAMRWISEDSQKFLAHGGFSVPLFSPLASDASGAVRNVYTPRSEPADGQGQLMRDIGRIAIEVDAAQLADALFHTRPGIGAWLFPEGKFEGPRRSVRLEWHELETIDVMIQNVYDVRLPLAHLGKAQRRGLDLVFGTLAKQPDGTWYGILHGAVLGRYQVVQGFGRVCPRSGIRVEQYLHVVGTPIDAFGPTHLDSNYQFPPAIPGGPARRPADFEKLSLEFVPASPPEYRRGPNRCWPVIPTPLSPDPFIPFNDAQWTIEHAGYGIAIPEEGELRYTEVGGAGAGGTPGSGSSDPLGAALGRLLTTANFGTSTWHVSVERRRVEP